MDERDDDLAGLGMVSCPVCLHPMEVEGTADDGRDARLVCFYCGFTAVAV